MVIIVECDEYQHSGYNNSCEHARMDRILDEFNSSRVVIIRWNPDGYKLPNNKKKNRKHRLKMLINLIDDICSNNSNIYFNTIVYYMFYSIDNEKVTNCRLYYKTLY